VESAAFSPDGRRIVTASADGTTRIWDVATAKQIAVLRGNRFAAFSPDGTRIVTASNIRDMRFATMSTKDLVTEVCTRRLHNLGITKLDRDEMRMAGFPDDRPEIDVCAGVE
jgi:WD40 repeat protein